MKIRLLALALLITASGCEPGQEAPDNEPPTPAVYPDRQPETQPPEADTTLADTVMTRETESGLP